MPAQPLLCAAALVDEVVAMIDQQLELPVDTLVWPRLAQVRLSERCPGDRERVDRVRFASGSSRPPLGGRSASAAPAPAPHRRSAIAARASLSAADSPQPPTAARRTARRCS